MQEADIHRRHKDGMIRVSAAFYGYVQGVGFRYTASHAASMLGLTGWVKNEYDGSVTSEVQGNRESIEKWIKMISSGRFIRIDRVAVDLLKAENT